MCRHLEDFEEIWAVDFEFSQPEGEQPVPLCLVAREARTGRLIRMWRNELLRYIQAPFRTDGKVLVIAYYASAEMSCFLAMGWPLPENLLDLYAEFCLITSGLPTPCGRSFLGALTCFGVPGGVSELYKDEMRDLAQRGGEYTDQERRDLLDYCATDVLPLADLLRAMQKAIESPPTLSPGEHRKALGQALLRGDYVKAVAEMETRGTPIDVPSLLRLRANWQRMELTLIAHVNQDFGVYVGDSFITQAFERYLARQRIAWPRTLKGVPKLDRDTFKEMTQAYPVLAPLHELRSTLAQMKEWKLPVGRDGRNRCLLSPFGAKTGRNTPGASEFVFALASWLRGLVKPPKGQALGYLDYEQQEFGIAAVLSGDRNMLAAYRSGDPYLEFARQAGAVPADATKESHGPTRDRFKTCALGVQYGMGAEALAYRINDSFSKARELLRLHKETYPHYWKWSEASVSYAMLYGHLTATYGWRVHVGPQTRPTSLRNFLLQANGAEMLRIACILASERRLPVCCPIHDALLVEDAAERIDNTVAATKQAMIEASEKVLPGFPLRVEAKIFRWPGRYADRRGEKMWKTVWGLINGEN
jgi:hypothetical protein